MNQPTFIDIFAGAGGASTGLINAGYNCIAAVEIDDWACDTYALNHPGVEVIRKDIHQVSNNDYKKFIGIDLIVGGPPCQGFSIAASNRRKKNDPRNDLYLEYLRAVKIIKPNFIIIENVKEIIKYRLDNGGLLLQDLIQRLDSFGYKTSYEIINAKFLGVPQDRSRFFLIGSLKEKINFIYKDPNPSFISLNDAISDLPIPVPGIDVYNYPSKPLNAYQDKLRNNSHAIHNHEPMRHTDRIIERFKHISYSNSILDIPAHLRNRVRGDPEKLSDRIYFQNHRRLNPDEPSKTITASFYSSFIHPYQHRNLTVREAARIQGFPDKFIFLGKRTTLSNKLLQRKGIFEDIHLDQFNQVGNAVSPIVAEYLGKIILENAK